MTNVGEKTCPLCTEEMDLTDQQLKPCKCGYEICVWCWHHIMDMAEKEDTEGKCPACRTAYDKEKIVGMAASCERLVAEINSEKKLKPQKMKSRTNEGRKQLSSVRVIQRNLAYIMGIPSNLADEDVLQRREYFGQYGKVLKASMSRTAAGAIQYSSTNTCSVYITYSKEEEAVRCIQSVHGYILEGKSLRACFGTTKYCHTWLRNMPCNNPDCVYLHDIGPQEDSFTQDEIISAYTRSRVQQITGATNNLQRSGDVLPPPVDDFRLSGTTSTKPISRTSSDNPLNQLNVSPPNSSSGRSISLLASASWGLRVGHPRTATSVCSNEPANQNHEACNDSSSFPSVVATTVPASMLHIDVGKKTWVIGEACASHSNGGLGSLDNSKQHTVMDYREIMPYTPGEVVQDASPNIVTSRPVSYLAASKDDRCIKMVPDTACSEEIERQSCIAASDKDCNVAVDGKIQSVCSGLSSIGFDSYHKSEDFDATEPNPSLSNLIVRSSRIQQSYNEHARRPLTSLPPSNASTSDGVRVSREPSDWGSESQTQVLRDTCSAVENELLAPSEQNSKFSEGSHPVHLSRTSSSFKNSSVSNGYSWQHGHACCTSDSVNASAHTRADEALLPFIPSGLVMSTGYTENNISTSAGLENFSGNSNFFSSVEKGKYSGRPDDKAINFEKNTSVDMGENRIISDILSLDFDPWDESLASPHNFAKLLSETDKQLGCFKITSSRKVQNNNQSRFSFARQVEFANKDSDSVLSHSNIGHAMNNNSTPEESRDNQDTRFDELSSGLPCRLLEESDNFSSSSSIISSNRLSGSRAQVSAPPGFSVPSKIPPPGFSTQERMDKAFDATTVNHFLGSSSLLRYPLQPTTNLGSIEDVEFFDPAILAVGTGTLPNGMNNLLFDMRSTFVPEFGPPENDPRIQLLRQQSISPQQSLRYSDHFGERFSPFTEVYNTPSRYLEQSRFTQPSFQPRTERVSHGWDSWNEIQSGNELGMAEFFRNERFGLNKYFPEYDDQKSRMHKQSDLYKAYGM